MRVLAVANGEPTHTNGMIPLLWELKNRGHHVVLAHQPGLTDHIRSTGITGVQVGTDHNLWRALAWFGATTDGTRSLLMCFDDLTGPVEVEREYRGAIQRWWHVVNRPMLDDLVAFSRQWAPELIIWEAAAFSGSIVAEQLGVPHVRFCFGLDFAGGLRDRWSKVAPGRPDPLEDWICRLSGLPAEKVRSRARQFAFGCATFSNLPLVEFDEMGRTQTVDYRWLRPIPFTGKALIPDWLRAVGPTPLVSVCMGLSRELYDRDHLIRNQQLAARIADSGICVVLTGAAAPSPGEVAPGRVRVAGFVPLDPLADASAAVVNHGGPSTVLTVAGRGVPQVILPRDSDEPRIAQWLARQGCAVVVEPGEHIVERAASAVRQILAEERFQVAARQLADRMNQAQSPALLASEFEKLAFAVR